MRILTFITLSLVITLAAMAQDVTNISVNEYFLLLMQSVGGSKGASGLAIAAVIVQIIMYSLRLEAIQSKIPKLLGKHKFLLIYALSLVSGIMSLRLQGVDLMAALLHSNTLAAYQVLAHQAFKQLKENPEMT